MTTSHHWHEHAACRGVPTAMFFPVTPSGGRRWTVPPEIAAVCDPCPVREHCLHYALDHGEHGVWGGTTEQQREAILRRIRRRACPACTSTQLANTGLAQACTACGTSWMATTTPSRSSTRRPRLGVNRTYSSELRRQAVQLALTPDPDGHRPSIASVARQLRINRESLRQWVLAADPGRLSLP